MQRFFFHLTVDDECFPDRTGREFDSLAEAHSEAVLLASHVMSYFECENKTPRTVRHVVTVADQDGQVPLSVIVRCESVTCDVRRVPTRTHRISA